MPRLPGGCRRAVRQHLRQYFGVIVPLLAIAVLVVPRAPARGNQSGSPTAATTISHIHGLAVDPFDSRVLWVATHSGLFRVAGRSAWTRAGNSEADMMGFVVHPSRRGVMLTSGHPAPAERRPNPLGVAISLDGGQRWESLALAGRADFHAMAISPAAPQTIYAWNVWRDLWQQEGLYRSRDGGLTWEPLGRAGLSEVFALRAHPQQPNTVLAATERGLLRSHDGGRSWTPLHFWLTGVAVTALDVHAGRPSIMYAYTGAAHLGLVRSTDAGRTWSSLGFHQGDGDHVTHLALDPKNPWVLYMATAGGSLFRSQDGGRSRQRMVNQGRVELP